jgi:hypothetical protein
MGYIASRNKRARIVVVANEQGYKPILKHGSDDGSLQQLGAKQAMAKCLELQAAMTSIDETSSELPLCGVTARILVAQRPHSP